MESPGHVTDSLHRDRGSAGDERITVHTSPGCPGVLARVLLEGH